MHVSRKFTFATNLNGGISPCEFELFIMIGCRMWMYYRVCEIVSFCNAGVILKENAFLYR